MQIDRKYAAELGRDTLQILERGYYQTEAGEVVAIRQIIDHAVQNTKSYPPDVAVPHIQPGRRQTLIEVKNETTLTAARRLTQAGLQTTALNFASAKNPGGGFLSGARAQEESLARSSGLFACLDGQAMYEYHRNQRDAMYSDYAIYSADVPVFRSDDGALLNQPYLCSFVTCAAVNAKVVLEIDPSRSLQIRDVMRQRIARVLSIAARHKGDALVLGAWGCGAFGNNTEDIAELFREALSGDASGNFEHIVFAITDWSDNSRFIGPFYRRFADQTNDYRITD